jgi:hypothetical protein
MAEQKTRKRFLDRNNQENNRYNSDRRNFSNIRHPDRKRGPDNTVAVTEPPNYTRLSRKIIQRKDNLTNLSPYNPVVREISTDFKLFHITAKIVLSLVVTIISYIKVHDIKYIGV